MSPLVNSNAGSGRSPGWRKDQFAEAARVEALTRRVGLGLSAFHLHFRTETGLSPLQYPKPLRVQEARRLMLGDRLDAAEGAYRVGYENPSHFGRE